MKELSDKIQQILIDKDRPLTTGQIIKRMLKKYPELIGTHVNDNKFFGSLMNCKTNLNKRWVKISRAKWLGLLKNNQVL